MAVIYKKYERTNCQILLLTFKMDFPSSKTYINPYLNIFIYENN